MFLFTTTLFVSSILYFRRGAASGRTIYVSGDGNDASGDGSKENPFGTIAHAVSVAEDNDSIILLGSAAFNENIGEFAKHVAHLQLRPGSNKFGSIEAVNGNHLALQRSLLAGASYYIDPSNGQDTNDGSINSPFKSIGRGLEAASDGDLLFIANGSYNENLFIWAQQVRTLQIVSGGGSSFGSAYLVEGGRITLKKP
eukprot:TRINITY_DN19646_c0_g1_i1.p2 TRINITY_DN19646_c0_g1~~TRINITY_DN19646_c0_g1_i1.p2  ORF type:complete len:198 (-),score=21.25 TRINITY_DN19646_c0_g1_i1:91-684(-)